MNTKTFLQKTLVTLGAIALLVAGLMVATPSASAQPVNPYPSLYVTSSTSALPYYNFAMQGGGNTMFYQQIAQFLGYLNGGTMNYFPGFSYNTSQFTSSNNSSNNNNRNLDEPDVETDDADDITDDEAELNGEIDMNDFEDGYVFFVYGEDEDQVEDATDEDEYDDIDEDGDDLQKVRVDNRFDGSDDFSEDIDDLDRNTEYFFVLCVEYEDEDGDETLECGSVEEFETDN